MRPFFSKAFAVALLMLVSALVSNAAPSRGGAGATALLCSEASHPGHRGGDDRGHKDRHGKHKPQGKKHKKHDKHEKHHKKDRHAHHKGHPAPPPPPQVGHHRHHPVPNGNAWGHYPKRKFERARYNELFRHFSTLYGRPVVNTVEGMVITTTWMLGSGDFVTLTVSPSGGYCCSSFNVGF